MSKLEAKGRDILRKQYYERSKVAREAIKLENGRLELFKVDYKNGQRVISAVQPFDVIKVATFEGYALAAADVMRAVGHNRLDVLQTYL